MDDDSLAESGDKVSLHPLSIESLVQRHENRQFLLQRLSVVREQIKSLENEVADIESLVNGLPYVPSSASHVRGRESLQRFTIAATAGAGGIALPLSVGIVHPLDTIRTTMQASGHGFSQSLRSLGWRGLGRGFGMSLAWAAPQGAVRMASYEACKEKLLDKFYVKPFGIAVSAVLADFTTSVLKVPRELITQRMQTGQYTSSLQAVRSILREDGIGGFFSRVRLNCVPRHPVHALVVSLLRTVQILEDPSYILTTGSRANLCAMV